MRKKHLTQPARGPFHHRTPSKLFQSDNLNNHFFQVTHITQVKLYDCWWACIRMLQPSGLLSPEPPLSFLGACSHHWRCGDRSPPPGPATRAARRGCGGGYLDFADGGGAVLRENRLAPCGRGLRGGDFTAVTSTLRAYGPLIFGGRFGPHGADHFVVVSGLNPTRGQVFVHDPGWFGHTQWRPADWLRHTHRDPDGEYYDFAVLRPADPLRPSDTG